MVPHEKVWGQAAFITYHISECKMLIRAGRSKYKDHQLNLPWRGRKLAMVVPSIAAIRTRCWHQHTTPFRHQADIRISVYIQSTPSLYYYISERENIRLLSFPTLLTLKRIWGFAKMHPKTQ